ncbi:MAG: uncharacterized protein QOJ67_3520 [Acidimicrobiaceae bacterium]
MGLLGCIAIVLVGAASGVLSGMFGVGGAVLTTPGVRAFGASPLEAVGSTIPAILPGALSGAWRYSREGLVEWPIALTSGALGSVFAVGGAELSEHINGHYLMLVTAALCLFVSLASFARLRLVAGASLAGSGGARRGAVILLDDAPPASPRLPFALVCVIGCGAGLMAGLLGVGGGVLLVPAYTALLRMPPKRAVATSLVAVAMFSVPAMATHAWLRHINWTFALLLVVGVVPGAQLGAHLTLHGSEERLRLLMGLFFSVLAIGYGASELLAL